MQSVAFFLCGPTAGAEKLQSDFKSFLGCIIFCLGLGARERRKAPFALEREKSSHSGGRGSPVSNFGVQHLFEYRLAESRFPF